MRSLLLLSLALVTAAGCSSSDDHGDGGATADLAAPSGPDMALLSRCGHPGDVGNSLGVGKFCTNQGPDCGGNGMATLCSALTNGQTPMPTDTYFCSFLCQPTVANVCGENAACLCNSSGSCACIPTSCIPPDGGA